MMARTQITLTLELQRKARRRADELGISFAEYIRRLVRRDLTSPSADAVDVSAVFDLGGAGPSDIAREKDDLIGRAVAEPRKPYGADE